MAPLPVIGIIVPAFNEEAVLPVSLDRLVAILDAMADTGTADPDSFILVVDDGSRDATWKVISEASRKNIPVRGIRLARNFGHQQALLAGLSHCSADAFITIDADLQDDESVIPEMVDHYRKGSHVVYGVRRSRKADTLFKRISAQLFYKIMQRLGTDVIYNHADYRLMSREVVDKLMKYREVNLFLRAIVPGIGYHQSSVYYDRKERLAGTSKYPVRAMIAFAWNGVTSFSTVPLKLVSMCGMIVFLMTLIGAIYSLIQKLTGNVIPGWTSTVLPIFFLGGVQLLSVGVIGEYIGKIYQEVKARPRYIIDKEAE